MAFEEAKVTEIEEMRTFNRVCNPKQALWYNEMDMKKFAKDAYEGSN